MILHVEIGRITVYLMNERYCPGRAGTIRNETGDRGCYGYSGTIREKIITHIEEEIIMKRMKKDNKGFTLVELIVVLVILAILAAILVPALLGYIDKAKEKQIVLNAKSCYTAAQAKYSELYAKDATTPSKTDKEEIKNMADVKGLVTLEVGTGKAFTAKDHDSYTVNYIHYKDGDGEIWLYNGSWTTTDPKVAPANLQAIVSGGNVAE